MWLLPNKPWEQLSLSLDLSHEEDGRPRVLYPHPMPLKRANARFNFNMMYIKEFGVEGDSTMLPRQFYRLPAHKQYSHWPKLLSSSCANPVELLSLYRQIRSEDWFQLRRHPQFLGQGWSQECIPNEAQRECCT